MELFNLFRKKKKDKPFEPPKKEKAEAKKEGRINLTQQSEKPSAKGKDLSRGSVIKPHVTEKSSLFGEKGVYVFKVKPSFNKIMVKAAIKNNYGVSPLKIRIINTPPKIVSLKRRRVAKPGFKKAIVYLKKGEKINI